MHTCLVNNEINFVVTLVVTLVTFEISVFYVTLVKINTLKWQFQDNLNVALRK